MAATAVEHAAIAAARADRVADHLTANADVLTRHGINVPNVITRIRRDAAAGRPAYEALAPITNLGDRIARISDRLLGIRTSRGGRDVTFTSTPPNGPDGDVLLEIAMNLLTNIPADLELYRHYSR